MKILKIALLITLGVIGIFIVGCGSAQKTDANKRVNYLEIINAKGVLKIEVKKDAPNFALLNPQTGKIEGFEIDMAKMITKDILGDESKLVLEPVTAKTRGPLLDNGTLDAVIATSTITEERKNL